MNAYDVRTLLKWIDHAHAILGAPWVQAVGAGCGAVVHLRLVNRLLVRRPDVVAEGTWVGPAIWQGSVEGA